MNASDQPTTQGGPARALPEPRHWPWLQRLVDRYWPSRLARELRKRSTPGYRKLPSDGLDGERGEWTLVLRGGPALMQNSIAALEALTRELGARGEVFYRLRAACEAAERERGKVEQ